MSQELGKLHKPDAEKFRHGRKVYLVPLLYEGPEAPDEYREKCTQYWEEVRTHLDNLESKLGRIARVFHETVVLEGEDGLKTLDALNKASSTLVREKLAGGSEFSVVENKEMVEENMDWERCLFMGFITSKVAGLISDYYMDSARKRYEYMSAKIDELLQDNEAAVIFLREGHMVQFARDIEIFNVAPPSLNDIHRWLRDQAARKPADSSGPAQ